jgi:protein-disulfide isomerase
MLFDPAIDHVRGPAEAPALLMYGDYQCPHSYYAWRQVEKAKERDAFRIAFRHFPRQHVHPQSLAAAAAVEAAGLQGKFWEMHDHVFRNQWALEDRDLRRYAAEIGLDVSRFQLDRFGPHVLARIGRDVASGLASGEIRETPTLFIGAAVYREGWSSDRILAAVDCMRE